MPTEYHLSKEELSFIKIGENKPPSKVVLRIGMGIAYALEVAMFGCIIPLAVFIANRFPKPRSSKEKWEDSWGLKL